MNFDVSSTSPSKNTRQNVTCARTDDILSAVAVARESESVCVCVREREERVSRRSVAMEKGKRKALPVVIIPGFMSSGLEVLESGVSKSWIGKRVWLNLQSVGFERLFERQESIKKGKAFSDREYEASIQCKNAWLQHMSLSEDMCRERHGNKVRPIDGLEGVDYLTDSGLTHLVSYVFGPVIQFLKRNSIPVSAAPYDWRVPPSVLEQRDGYFTKTMRHIEKVYAKNGPVVLLCHSLGCKTGHYLLNFVLDHPKGGRRWIQKHIHTFMPVGAPHLGAPKAIRAHVDGDKMGLGPILSERDTLILGRSLGSACWMIPLEPPGSAPFVFLRKEGIVYFSIAPIDVQSLMSQRRDCPELRLVMVVGKKVLTTDFQTLTRNRGRLTFSFNGMFSFPLVELHGAPNVEFQVMLQERGIQAGTKKAEAKQSCCGCIMSCIGCIICCPFKVNSSFFLSRFPLTFCFYIFIVLFVFTLHDLILLD